MGGWLNGEGRLGTAPEREALATAREVEARSEGYVGVGGWVGLMVCMCHFLSFSPSYPPTYLLIDLHHTTPSHLSNTDK